MRKRLLIIFSMVLLPVTVCAMTSENFKINADVIGSGGGTGSSENFGLIDTIGESVMGPSASESYKVQAGFFAMTNYSISLTVDSDTKDIGLVNPGGNANATSLVNVVTDSWGGYDLLISENHSMLHADAVTTIADYGCTILSPCLWSGSGFGFTITSGTNVDPKWESGGNYKYAQVPQVAGVFHSKAGYMSGNDQTAIQYQIAVPIGQKAGNYSNIITYTAAPKL